MGRFRRFFNSILRRFSPHAGTQNVSTSSLGSTPQGSQEVVVLSPSSEEVPAPLSQVEPPQYLSSSPKSNSPPPVHHSVSVSYQTSMTNNTTEDSSDVARQGLFQNATNFSINQPIMGEHVEIHQQNSNIFENMRLNYVIRGAEFDSADRDYPPQCHPGTRVRFLGELQTHIRSGTKMVWVRGPAGVGKSAIMQTFAETIPPDFICTTLFLSRPNKRDDPKKVFSTLAYRLVDNGSYRQYLGGKLTMDSSFLDKSIEEQFKRLFVTPFIDNRIDTGAQPWVVLLDGLDECKGEQEQGRIVDVIRESILRHGHSMPFVWVIASRPEAHLSGPFTQVEKEIGAFWTLEIPIDSDEALQDVERHLRAAFAKIRRDYSDMVPSRWPSEGDILKFLEACSGLFVFASVSMAYIAESNPVLRFAHILTLTTQHNTNSDGVCPPTKNPFEMLDLLYTTIMSDIPPESLPTTKAILGFRLLGQLVGHPRDGIFMVMPNLLEICNILGLKQHMAYAALRRLNSVLAFPSQRSPDDGVWFLHTSFSDFLKDESRSHFYHIDLNEELERIWWRYVEIIRQSTNSADDVALSWEHWMIGNTELRRDLLRIADHKWLEIVIGCCHTSCPSIPCKAADSYRFLPSTSDLIEVLQDIRPAPFGPGNTNVVLFRDWLSSHSPPELRQQMILKEYNGSEIDEIEVNSMFEGLDLQRWGYLGMGDWRRAYLDPIELTDLNSSKWNELKRLPQSEDDVWIGPLPSDWTILYHLLKRKMNRTTLVTVIKMRTSDYVAVIGTPDYESIWSEWEISHVIVPYHPRSTEESESSPL